MSPAPTDRAIESNACRARQRRHSLLDGIGNGPPQAQRPHACLCEMGPRRGRSAPSFTAKVCSRQCHGGASKRRRPCLRLAPLLLLAANAGCSPDSSDAGSAMLAGTHSFVCANGTKVRVEFLGDDGLTVEAAILPDGETERLTSPAAGVTYFGDTMNLSISNDWVVVIRPDAKTQICQRAASNQPRDGRPTPLTGPRPCTSTSARNQARANIEEVS